MRILHTADWHACKARWAEVVASLDTLETDAVANGCALFVVPGDLADGPLQNSERDVFDALAGRVQRLANIAPVALVYGTPTHDAPGSLEVFERMSTRFPIVILRPGKAYFLNSLGGIHDGNEDAGRDSLLLFGVPEPNKRWLLANTEAVGKDASDAALRDAMRSMLLGLGAIRRQHADLPCVLLYHGQVSGARTGTGYTAGSGIAVSKDDLAAVGADYIAMGDIHLPQQIPGLPAYYPGSIYPKDWGETHQSGANVVTIDGWTPTHNDELFGDASDCVVVERLDFPHAQRLKVSSKPGEHPISPAMSGKMVWLEFTATKEEAEKLDLDSWECLVQAAGALPGSRVTLNILPTETVRAGEITAKKTLRDKLAVWSENSSTPIPDSAYEKADRIEREAAARGAVGSGARIRINRLVLRGAIGIWKNQRKDEIEIDFDACDGGVIAFVGANGSGKTTIFENLHPWPQLLTRDGSLKNHFRLKDSCRDLYFTDDTTGIRYRARLDIRADIASGGVECWLFRDTGKGFEPVPGIEGRQDAYLDAVGSLFGSLEMYLRTAFQTQRPTSKAPDLAETTKGQRKDLFAELSGIDYLGEYTAEAKGQADALDVELVKLDAIIAAAADVDATIDRLAIEASESDVAATGAEERARNLSAQDQILKAKREAAALRVGELDRKAARLSDIEREIAALLRDVETIEREVGGFRSAAAGREEAAASLAKIDALQAERAQLLKAKAAIDAANHRALEDHQRVVSEIDGQRREAQTALDAARGRKATAEREAAVARAGLAAPIVDHCPTCAQLLPEEKRRHLTEERAKLEARIATLADVVNAAGIEETNAEAALGKVITPPAPEPTPFEGAARLQAIDDELAFGDDVSVLRDTIRKADEAAVRIEAAEKAKVEKIGRLDALRMEALAIGGILTERSVASAALAAIDADLESARTAYTDATSAAAAARASAESSRRAIADAEKRRDAKTAAETERTAKAAELSDWRLLERATGPDGIQALELDALAPSIADVANRLLAVQSPRYSVEFRTTRIGGTGKKSKQIETFEIYVLDSETGTEQEIGTLSGGEGVWIKRAILDAFAAIRARNTGVQFLTVMQDETDGALDPEARMAYLRMLEAAHAESGRHQTLLITHSTELQAMVAQTIDVWALEGRKRVEAAA